MWFHLPLISALLLMCSLGAVFLSRRAKKMKRQLIQRKSEQVESLLAEMEEELWKEENEIMLQRFYLQFSSLGWTSSKVDLKIQEIRGLQSLQAGVSMAYLLQDFKDLVQQRSREVDPTFLHLKDVFWGCEDKIGQDVLCPRDGQLGCALVDWLPRHHRRQQIHNIMRRLHVIYQTMSSPFKPTSLLQISIGSSHSCPKEYLQLHERKCVEHVVMSEISDMHSVLICFGEVWNGCRFC